MNLLPVIFATNETGLEVQNLLAQAPAHLGTNTVLRQQTILPMVNNFGFFSLDSQIWCFCGHSLCHFTHPSELPHPFTLPLLCWCDGKGEGEFTPSMQKSITWGGHRFCLTCWKDSTGEKLPKSKGVRHGDQKALWTCHKGTRVRAKMLDQPPQTSNSDIFPRTSRKLVILH